MTRRDTIEAQRAGYVAGLRAAEGINGYIWTPERQRWAENLACTAFPLPTVTRPRIVRIGCAEHKVEGGEYFVRTTYGGESFSARQWKRSRVQHPELIELLRLIERPTETVEVDA